eukprot:CAMPEP_0195526658 /NCGR_PEP_ID=MMETSP0794_2-20130614/27852_1 /TAXON_ID=515487 /ORGANISM="Stephanopyxis turris, Strain CCMP 815" /LENGTH=174 /DNA_ID=CAMNT_0040657399 /DNA_START=130 /DNA_END=651 /DNA_ORIENTATION=+
MTRSKRQRFANLREKGKAARFWMRTKAFRNLCKWSFDICDRDSSGEIDKTELYAGLLLVHINLAKYAGPAACYPPDREVVESLFEASDDNNSGGIDEEEFLMIMIILCSQITFRIIAYYFFLIFIVPYLVTANISILNFIGVDDTIRVFNTLIWDKVAPTFLQRVVDLIPDKTW